MAEDSDQNSVWNNVIIQTKEDQEKGSDPLLWSVQVSSILSFAGVSIPSPELADVLVSYIPVFCGSFSRRPWYIIWCPLCLFLLCFPPGLFRVDDHSLQHIGYTWSS